MKRSTPYPLAPILSSAWTPAFLTTGEILGEKITALQWLSAGFTLYGLYRLMEEPEDSKKSQKQEEASSSVLEVQPLSADSLST